MRTQTFRGYSLSRAGWALNPKRQGLTLLVFYPGDRQIFPGQYYNPNVLFVLQFPLASAPTVRSAWKPGERLS